MMILACNGWTIGVTVFVGVWLGLGLAAALERYT